MKLKLKIPRPTKKSALITIPVVLIAAVAIFQIKLFVGQDGRSVVAFRDVEVQGSTLDGIKSFILAQSSTVELKTDRQVLEVSNEDIGVSVDESALMDSLETTQSWQNFVPVWGIKTLSQTKQIKVAYSVDQGKLALAINGLVQQLSSAPQSAEIIQEGAGVAISPELAGLSIDADQLKAAIINHFNGENSPEAIAVPATEIQPEITTASLEAVVSQFEFIAGSSIDVTIDDYVTTLDAAALFGLVKVGADKISLDDDAVDQLIAQWSKQVSSVASDTYVEYIDDVEISRIAGSAGRSLSTNAAEAALNGWFNDPESVSDIKLATTVVESKVVKTFKYTSTSLGLQKELEAWDAANAGSYYIAIREIGGQGREAYISSNTPVVMASTYKMFLSVAAYKMAENNELSLSTVIYQGKDIEECIRLGIVYSNNSCMVALGEHIGWDYAESIVNGLGFSSVRLNNYLANGSYDGDKMASAKDMTNLLVRLHGGTLISSTNKNQLISYMKVSNYRSGIPAGSSGAVVANKVGFLYSYIHDMGIVYGSGSTYAITILTSNSSWGKIDSAAQLVYDFLN